MKEGQAQKVLQVGDPFLENVLPPIENPEAFVARPSTQSVLADMVATCLVMNGMGISANQIGSSHRMFVMKPLEWANYEAFINPEIIESGGRSRDVEGCLSFRDPVVKYQVRRKFWVVVEYYNKQGVKCSQKFEEYDARCVQHEIDHLNGITMDKVGKKK